ncbi:hypothetical protein EDC44_1183 [Cricetibacter osteomyelitidis]|uniref:Uncharacterized protein n=1 Tax=Cricetibacter osteomyelitidis TaxID=1521931 RepID=A0A4R2SY87_9PAST|nr:hypothetical protein [Cricetibacter osteomyelitidis]TCP93454.1 hypothetical protein EDC44_1183 [Cricetibacter osteomyelitidis]
MDILALIFGIILFGVVWHFFIRMRCPDCNSTNITEEGYKEIDRYLARKRVTEKMASGKTRERYINCTMSKRKYFYTCDECKTEWTKIKKVELS